MITGALKTVSACGSTISPPFGFCANNSMACSISAALCTPPGVVSIPNRGATCSIDRHMA
jgi:hypothetical protein